MIYTVENLKPIFDLLEFTKKVEQKDVYHPEGNLYIHTAQVTKLAFRESTDIDLIFAAMLHDVGKIVNTHGHEDYSVQICEPFSSVKTLWLIEHHMRIWKFLRGEMKKLGKVLYLAEHPWLPELILLARWDKKGRVPGKNLIIDPQETVDRLNKIIWGKYETI